MDMLNSDKTKNHLNNVVCMVCRKPIDIPSEVDDLCKECFLKCVEVSSILEYLRNTRIDNLNVVNRFINDNSFAVKTVIDSSDIKKTNSFYADLNSKANETSAVIVRQSTSEKIKIDKECFVLGCSMEKADYAITTLKTISRVHAKIEKISGCYFLVDTNSKNGTKLNNAKIRPGEKIILKNGDEILLSTEAFIFLLE